MSSSSLAMIGGVFFTVNVTRHPTSAWIAQQLREAFPYEPATKFLILDHDAKYGREVPAAPPISFKRKRSVETSASGG